jgi:hypothetical protein
MSPYYLGKNSNAPINRGNLSIDMENINQIYNQLGKGKNPAAPPGVGYVPPVGGGLTPSPMGGGGPNIGLPSKPNYGDPAALLPSPISPVPGLGYKPGVPGDFGIANLPGGVPGGGPGGFGGFAGPAPVPGGELGLPGGGIGEITPGMGGRQITLPADTALPGAGEGEGGESYVDDLMASLFGKGFETIRGVGGRSRENVYDMLAREGLLGTGAAADVGREMAWQTERGITDLTRKMGEMRAGKEKEAMDMLMTYMGMMSQSWGQ